ncbi:MAG: phospholipase D family protein [Candidatus Omnitrophota bacterium]
MKIKKTVLVLLLLSSHFFPFLPAVDAVPHAYFSPKGGCTQAIVDAIDQAQTSILVQAYSFTSQPIAEALVNAHKRGVRVKILLDKSQKHAKGSKLNLLIETGVPVSIDSKHSIAHNKVMIIDEVIVITGSFNFTNTAEDKNAENLLVVQDKILAKKYRDNWNKHQRHSERHQV